MNGSKSCKWNWGCDVGPRLETMDRIRSVSSNWCLNFFGSDFLVLNISNSGRFACKNEDVLLPEISRPGPTPLTFWKAKQPTDDEGIQ